MIKLVYLWAGEVICERGIAYTDDEENACEHRRRHGMQDDEQRTGHGTPNGHAHQEVTDTLLNYSSGFHNWFANLIAVFGLRNLKLGFVYSK